MTLGLGIGLPRGGVASDVPATPPVEGNEWTNPDTGGTWENAETADPIVNPEL